MAQNIELKLLKLMCNKAFYNANFTSISAKVLSTEVKSLLRVIDKLHKLSDKDINISDIVDMYENSTTITTAKVNLVKQIVVKIQELPVISPEVALEIIEKLSEKEAARIIADKAWSIVERHEGAGTLKELQDFVGNISIRSIEETEDKPYLTDINEVLADKDSKGVFEFGNGLEFLNEGTGKLSRGHFVIVFAPTNAGKSSFMAQADCGYLQAGHKVLYIANEEPPHKILLNHVRSIEKKANADLITNPITPLWDKYRHKFILIPATGKTFLDITNLAIKYKPDVIILDQLDNVEGIQTKDKLQEAYKKLYRQARALASTQDCLVFAVTQASDDATGKLVLRKNMMEESKVAKQTAADVIIGIGMRSEDEAVRGITLCKNKDEGIHKTYHCILNHNIARYEL